MERAEIIDLLKKQQEFFGDLLFDHLKITIPKVQKSEKSGKDEVYSPSSNTVNDTAAVYQAAAPPVQKVNTNSHTERITPAEIPQVFSNITTLYEFEQKICNCQKCDLAKGRNKFVFGKGNPNAKVMLIGEGPGADEDKQGEPFVGKAGQLLTDILKAIKFTREEVYIANVVKCRPPANRTPFPAEIEACMPYLQKQIELVEPKLILLFGATAVLGLLGKKATLSSLRGKVFDYGSARVMVTYHPAALLRNPNLKRDTWADVQQFRKLYDELPAE